MRASFHRRMSAAGGALRGPPAARRGLSPGACLLLALVSAAFLAATDRAAAAPQEVTRHAKVELLGSFGRTFGGPPRLLILGSSRAMRADPAVWSKTLHTRVFNAAVSSGSAMDAYAFTRLAERDYPGSASAVVWFLDIETLRLGANQPYVRSVPALRRLLPHGVPGESRYVSASARALAGGAVPGHSSMPPRLRANGVLVTWWHDWQRAHGRTTSRGVREQIQQYSQIYTGKAGYRISGSSRWYATQIVMDANRSGVVPVIVLTPYHPALRRYISGRGWLQAHARVIHFLRDLGKRYRLRVLDLTSLKSFGGWPGGFYDGVHPRPSLMRSILRTVVLREHAYLQPPARPRKAATASASAGSAVPAVPKLPVGPGLSLSVFCS
jgi:hypothetical protein